MKCCYRLITLRYSPLDTRWTFERKLLVLMNNSSRIWLTPIHFHHGNNLHFYYLLPDKPIMLYYVDFLFRKLLFCNLPTICKIRVLLNILLEYLLNAGSLTRKLQKTRNFLSCVQRAWVESIRAWLDEDYRRCRWSLALNT